MAIFTWPQDTTGATIYAMMAVMVAVVVGINVFLLVTRGRPVRSKSTGKNSKKQDPEVPQTNSRAAHQKDTETDDDSSASSSSLLRVAHTPDGRGRGVLARRSVAPGECLASESALLLAPSHPLAALQTAFDQLDADAQDAFWSFTDSSVDGGASGKTLAGVMRTNCLPVGEEPETVAAPGIGDDQPLCRAPHAGLFTLLSRVNHSCLPNACIFWCGVRRRAVAYAVRSIAAAEEVTAPYLDDLAGLDLVQRRQRLRDVRRFTCTCALCTTQSATSESGATRSEARVASDANRRRIGTLSTLLPTLGADPARAAQTVDRILALLSEEDLSISPDSARVCDLAGRLLHGHSGFEARVADLASRAHEAHLRCHGSESAQSQSSHARLLSSRADLAAAERELDAGIDQGE